MTIKQAYKNSAILYKLCGCYVTEPSCHVCTKFPELVQIKRVIGKREEELRNVLFNAILTRCINTFCSLELVAS